MPTSEATDHTKASTSSGGRPKPNQATAVWDAPPVGQWMSGSDHVPTSVTPSMIELYAPARTEGMRDMFATYGFPAAGYGAAVVNGHLYDRVLPLIGADKPSTKLPPKALLWLATRLHPEFRKRNKAMKETFAPTRRWERELTAWNGHERAGWVTKNLALQDADLATLDDEALVDHLDKVVDHYLAAVTRHFSIKGLDSAPLGDLLALTQDAGIPAADVVAALKGASPASGIPEELTAVAHAVAEAGVRPRSLDDIRGAGSSASDALDAYIRLYGTRIITGYDIDGRTLIELPDVIVNSVVAVIDHQPPSSDEPDESHEAVLARVRERVPADRRAEFDERFRHALSVYGVRDDNGPLTFQWPSGLLRRAFLEAGRRLTEGGKLSDPELAVELEVAELRRLLTGASTPSSDDILERSRRRAADSLLTPPDTLGPDEPAPPLDVMPEALARSVRAIETFIEAMGGKRDGRAPMTGTGINTTTYKGRAVVALSAEDALVMLEPGDVLVAPCTTPAYNSVLPIVGAVVTEEGGALCHAAVVARELGLPAVVGALLATTRINTGDTVEVDPVRGTVAVV